MIKFYNFFYIILTAVFENSPYQKNNNDFQLIQGILDRQNTNVCVFGPIIQNTAQNTFSFNSKLCIDPNQRIYSCNNGLDLDFKSIWNCDNYVIQEQISGKCLHKIQSKYYLGNCNTCTNNTFFNMTNNCLKPSLVDAIGTLLCNETDILFKNKIQNNQCKKPLYKIRDIEYQLNDTIFDVFKPTELCEVLNAIDNETTRRKNLFKKTYDIVGNNSNIRKNKRSTRKCRKQRRCY